MSYFTPYNTNNFPPYAQPSNPPPYLQPSVPKASTSYPNYPYASPNTHPNLFAPNPNVFASNASPSGPPLRSPPSVFDFINVFPLKGKINMSPPAVLYQNFLAGINAQITHPACITRPSQLYNPCAAKFSQDLSVVRDEKWLKDSLLDYRKSKFYSYPKIDFSQIRPTFDNYNNPNNYLPPMKNTNSVYQTWNNPIPVNTSFAVNTPQVYSPPPQAPGPSQALGVSDLPKYYKGQTDVKKYFKTWASSKNADDLVKTYNRLFLSGLSNEERLAPVVGRYGPDYQTVLKE